jgi:DNA-directed RNA polymerase subunit RPC12/RpoP
MTEEAAAQVKCPSCGYMNDPTATVCAECGAPMPTGATMQPIDPARTAVEFDGKRMTLSQWAEFLGIPYMRLWHLHRRAQVWPPK